MAVWHKVRKELRSLPIAEGDIGGATPLHAERYLLQRKDLAMSGYEVLGLITLFGGARVIEGQAERSRTSYLPTQALLLPPGCPTHWQFGGSSDFGIFYFRAPVQGLAERLGRLCGSAADPLQFSDALVGATALQIFNELQKRDSCDHPYLTKLADVMLEQTYRALTTPETAAFSLRHVHFPRLQKVLPHIREHLAEELSAQSLADLVGLSSTHFRRLFQEALGVPVHRYVQAARLEQARMLLGTTTMPIAKIAEESGFSSQSHLTSCFRSAHAATPALYRRQIGAASATTQAPASGRASRSVDVRRARAGNPHASYRGRVRSP